MPPIFEAAARTTSIRTTCCSTRFATRCRKSRLCTPGDYVLAYQRRGVQYNAEEKKLRFEGGDPVSAEAVLVEPGAVLFRIL